MVYAGDQKNFKTRSLHHLRRPQASFRSPEGEETLRPPGRILEAQAKLVSMAGSALQMETQPKFEIQKCLSMSKSVTCEVVLRYELI